MKKGRFGFTLIELLVVVTLVGILGTITTELLSSVFRGYHRAQITNEIQQNGSTVLSSWEQHIRNAQSVSPEGNGLKSIVVRDQEGVETALSLVQVPAYDNAAVTIGVAKRGDDILTNYHSVRGVDIVEAESFFDVSVDGAMQTVKILLKIQQAPSAPVRVDYRTQATLETTVVVRGGYQ